MKAFPRAALVTLVVASCASVANPQRVLYRNTNPNVRRIGSAACARCHREIAARYSQTAMARSLTLGDQFQTSARAQLPFTIFDSEANQYFEVSKQNGALIQSQYALDSRGAQIFRQTWPIAYVIGSGENGVSFLIQRDGFLFEAPLSYYTQKNLWAFSPGYQLHNYAFRRPAFAECLSCHSGWPQPVYGVAGLYADPPFLEMSVGCENCHGPGELHLKERSAGQPIRENLDTSIVNPARLSGWLSDNICMKCHQAGDVRVDQPGKHIQDFRPGMPLESVMEIYKEAPLYDSAPDSVLLEHYYSMILSKCYRQSSGRLHCTSCHDPHKQPAGVDAAAYYQARCMSCHNSQGCTLPVNERQKTTPPDNCIACHMTKRPVASITHAALTDHRVTVALGESLPADLVALDKSGHDLIRLTAHPGEEKRTTPDLVLFQVYARLIQDGRAEFRAPMDSLLNRFSHDAPSNSQVLSALARRQLEQGVAVSGELAATYLHKALSLGDADPDDLLLLATLESAANRHAAAIDILKSAIRKNPFSSEFADSLATEYQKTGNYKDCLDVVNRGLKLFPDDQALRALAEKARSAVDSIDHQ